MLIGGIVLLYFCLNSRNHRFAGECAAAFTVKHTIDLRKHPGRLIGRTSDHHAVNANAIVHFVEQCTAFGCRFDGTIEHNHCVGEIALKLPSAAAHEGRHFPVFFGRKPLQPSGTRMNNEGAAARIVDLTHKVPHKAVIRTLIDANTVFDRDGLIRCITHGTHALCHEFRVKHQTGAETPLLHAR